MAGVAGVAGFPDTPPFDGVAGVAGTAGVASWGVVVLVPSLNEDVAMLVVEQDCPVLGLKPTVEVHPDAVTVVCV